MKLKSGGLLKIYLIFISVWNMMKEKKEWNDAYFDHRG